MNPLIKQAYDNYRAAKKLADVLAEKADLEENKNFAVLQTASTLAHNTAVGAHATYITISYDSYISEIGRRNKK